MFKSTGRSLTLTDPFLLLCKATKTMFHHLQQEQKQIQPGGLQDRFSHTQEFSHRAPLVTPLPFLQTS